MDNFVEEIFPTVASLLSVCLRIHSGDLSTPENEVYFLWLIVGPALGAAIVIGLIILLFCPFW